MLHFPLLPHPGDIWQFLETFLVVTAEGISLVEAMDAGKKFTMHGRVLGSPNEELSGPKCH